MWRDLNAAGLVSVSCFTARRCAPVKPASAPSGAVLALRTDRPGGQLEQLTWGSWMPHKFKLAVSGCPRNCAEATIKDFGVVCVDSGYELHIGGNGGIKVRITDLLCKVATEEEVLGVLRRLYPTLP